MKHLFMSPHRALWLCALLPLLFSACSKETESPASVSKSAAVKGSAAVAKSGPVNVCYVEANNFPLASVGKYKLANSGANVFDIGIIFAANINYNTSTKAAELFFNPQVTSTLQNTATIKALQAKGIKVLLSVLGNHQGAGVCNFPNRASAAKFAVQCRDAVNKYGLDGIDIDDEYADYGANGTGQPNASSFVNFVNELRLMMPSKIISFYFIGPATSRQSYNGVTVGSKINYSWNAYYGTYSAPNVPGLSKAMIGPAATDVTQTSASTAATNATRTKNDGYGVYMCYNLTSSDTHTYLSGITQALYGEATVYTP